MTYIAPCKSVSWYFQAQYLLLTVLHFPQVPQHPEWWQLGVLASIPLPSPWPGARLHQHRGWHSTLPVHVSHQHPGAPSQPSRYFTGELLWSYPSWVIRLSKCESTLYHKFPYTKCINVLIPWLFLANKKRSLDFGGKTWDLVLSPLISALCWWGWELVSIEVTWSPWLWSSNTAPQACCQLLPMDGCRDQKITNLKICRQWWWSSKQGFLKPFFPFPLAELAKLQKHNSELEIQRRIQLKLQEKTEELKGKAQGGPMHIHRVTSLVLQEMGPGRESAQAEPEGCGEWENPPQRITVFKLWQLYPCRFTWFVSKSLSEHNSPCLCLRISWAICKVQLWVRSLELFYQKMGREWWLCGSNRDRSESHFKKIL